MNGNHQVSNAATSIKTIEVLKSQGIDISASAIISGIEKNSVPGRIEIFNIGNGIILDGGHNEESIKALSEYLKEKKKKDDDDNKPKPPSGGKKTLTEESTNQKEESSFEIYPANKGKLILDATCAPADIRYPTDLSLLNEAREKLDDIIDILHKTLGKPGKRPRNYRQVARRDYISIVRNKKPGKKTIRKAGYGLARIMARLKETAESVICLQFLVMNLEHRLRVLLSIFYSTYLILMGLFLERHYGV